MDLTVLFNRFTIDTRRNLLKVAKRRAKKTSHLTIKNYLLEINLALIDMYYYLLDYNKENTYVDYLIDCIEELMFDCISQDE